MVNCDRCHRKFASYAGLKQHYHDMHSKAELPAEFESKLVAEKKTQAIRTSLHPYRHADYRSAILAVIIIVVVVGAAWYIAAPHNPTSTPSITGDPTLSICNTDTTPLAEHIHPRLSIVVNGRAVLIPADIGLTPACERPVHTHDESGEIHIESPVVYSYTLHDFFLVWGQPFDNLHIMQYSVDSTHTLKMTVNGAANTQFDSYVMRDGDQIVIIYTTTR